MLYKDACNRKSNQQNLGTIKCSNLCTEIIEYTSPEESAVCNLASIALPRYLLLYNGVNLASKQSEGKSERTKQNVTCKQTCVICKKEEVWKLCSLVSLNKASLAMKVGIPSMVTICVQAARIRQKVNFRALSVAGAQLQCITVC